MIDSLRVEKEAITIGVLEALEKRSTPGLYDLLYVHDRKLDNRINQLEYDIDESFQSGAALTELMETFSGVLGAHLKGNMAISEYDFGEPTIVQHNSQADKRDANARVSRERQNGNDLITAFLPLWNWPVLTIIIAVAYFKYYSFWVEAFFGE
ncbi:MAG TPA: hypothetical protein PKC29_13650 [Thermodesulfobacteriota bacterium]|nr:hypothetical protein [Thermodesulfobacteriota bacterium]